MADNGECQAPINNAPIVEIVLRFSPATGQFQAAWPQVDDVMKLGMLDMAKVLLQEARIAQGMNAQSGLIVPARGIISKGN